MDLHEFLIMLIRTESLDLHLIKKLVLDSGTRPELVKCILTNYRIYETLLEIKNGMDLCHEGFNNSR